MTAEKKPASKKGAPKKDASKKATPKKAPGKQQDGVTKAVVEDDKGEWVTPKAGQAFSIDATPTFPSIVFEIKTEEAAPYKWKWTLTWDAKVSGLRENAKRGSLLKTYTEKGEFTSNDKKWTASLDKLVGGRLVVEVAAGQTVFKRAVEIKGTNPSAESVKTFLATLSDTDGFEELLEQESHFKNFINADGQPIVAFDKGYGMTQMTTPAPSFEQIWNWKENIKGGVKLYQSKQKEARAYLSQKQRTYTAEQLKLETWSRWNGGVYHVWDEKAKAWARNSNLMCDTATGNIGWNTTLEDNKGKTEDELHKRDKDSYSNPKKNKTEENKWLYTGVCYADHVNSH